MSGPFVWERPELVEANAAIMAAREAKARGLTAEDAEREALKARDIPKDCTCPEWHWSVRVKRWVRTRGRWRQSCPWHHRSYKRGAGGQFTWSARPPADMSRSA